MNKNTWKELELNPNKKLVTWFSPGIFSPIKLPTKAQTFLVCHILAKSFHDTLLINQLLLVLNAIIVFNRISAATFTPQFSAPQMQRLFEGNWQKVTCDWNYWHRIISMRSTDVNSRKLQGQGWSHYLKIIEFQRSTSFLIHCIEGVSHFTPLRAHLHITQQSLKVEPKDSRLRDSIRNQVKVSTVQWRPSMISFVKAILTSSMKWRNLSFWLEKAVF